VRWIDAGSWAFLEPGQYEFHAIGFRRETPRIETPIGSDMVVSPSKLLLKTGLRYSVTISRPRKPVEPAARQERQCTWRRSAMRSRWSDRPA
jgi:hypothetical protein